MALTAWARKRAVTNKVRWAIDNLLPPIISDTRWFNQILARAMYGNRPFDLDFREKLLTMTPEELQALYNEMGKWEPVREADTTPNQMAFVLQTIIGPRVLEIGCGNGRLSAQLAEKGFEVTACDLKADWTARLQEEFTDKGLHLRFQVANAESLPWPDASFDTVVSTHTLEHIPNLSRCLEEIRRVVRRRVIIVVPCQKYKRYTIDTHVHFFPTEAILRWSLGFPEAVCKKIDGDWAIVWDTRNEI